MDTPAKRWLGSNAYDGWIPSVSAPTQVLKNVKNYNLYIKCYLYMLNLYCNFKTLKDELKTRH